MLARNPIEKTEKVPSPGESDHGIVLEEDELRGLVDGFRTSVLFPIVAVAAFTGRNPRLAMERSQHRRQDIADRAVGGASAQAAAHAEGAEDGARQTHDRDR